MRKLYFLRDLPVGFYLLVSSEQELLHLFLVIVIHEASSSNDESCLVVAFRPLDTKKGMYQRKELGENEMHKEMRHQYAPYMS